MSLYEMEKNIEFIVAHIICNNPPDDCDKEELVRFTIGNSSTSTTVGL
jgi:hypothetical protein